MLALPIVAALSACAHKDRLAPCSAGEGAVMSYAAEEAPRAALPAVIIGAEPADPCGPLRRIGP